MLILMSDLLIQRRTNWGHIGLDHNEEESVTQSAGLFYSIQPIDIQAKDFVSIIKGMLNDF